MKIECFKWATDRMKTTFRHKALDIIAFCRKRTMRKYFIKKQKYFIKKQKNTWLKESNML